MSRKIILFILLTAVVSFSQETKIHVHNDFQQKIPFWGALNANAHSLEVDLFMQNNQLYVAHDQSEIINSRTLQTLYIQPMLQAFKLNIFTKPIQLLIDIKSEAYKTLEVLQEELKHLQPLIEQGLVKIIISGNKPAVKDYTKYPNFILFDFQDENIPSNTKILKKIGLVSFDFTTYSSWNGKGKIIKNEFSKIKSRIEKAHAVNKPIRFWLSPDSKSSWKVFADLQVDFINTDYPYECSKYIKTLPNRYVKNTVFSKVYTPLYKVDKKNSLVKNVILMIGDGNGLTQISSAVLANNGQLTLTQLKSTGLMKTQSADDFTTDSAASGTALATGKKTYNRAIGVDAQGNSAQNIIEYLSDYNFNTGCITTDEIFGATPAAFYAHQLDRSFENNIAKDLLGSKLTLFAGGGGKKFTIEQLQNNHFTVVSEIQNIGTSKAGKIGYFFSKGGVPSVLNGRANDLAEITKQSIAFLNKKSNPFFMMIEAAQIDTYGHHNNVAGVITETIDFDRAITEAIKFADKDQHTLVIVLADHETAGFSIPQGNITTHYIEGAFFSHDHTGELVPVFAYGPKSYEFEGCYENSDVFSKILKVLNLQKNTKQ